MSALMSLLETKGQTMDPEATLTIMDDESRDLYERGFAALDLLTWIAKGGGVPGSASKQSTIEACEMAILSAIEGF